MIPALLITVFNPLGGLGFNLKGGQINARSTPKSSVCNLVSVPKYTLEWFK